MHGADRTIESNRQSAVILRSLNSVNRYLGGFDRFAPAIDFLLHKAAEFGRRTRYGDHSLTGKFFLERRLLNDVFYFEREALQNGRRGACGCEQPIPGRDI